MFSVFSVRPGPSLLVKLTLLSSGLDAILKLLAGDCLVRGTVSEFRKSCRPFRPSFIRPGQLNTRQYNTNDLGAWYKGTRSAWRFDKLTKTQNKMQWAANRLP